MMKKLLLFTLCFFFISSAQAAPADDGILRWIFNAYRKTQAEIARRPHYQWQQFLKRQTVTPALIKVRENLSEHLLARLQSRRKLEKLVPVSKQTAHLLRMERNLEPFPKGLSLAEKIALYQRARNTRIQVQNKLLGRYKQLQNCLNNQPQLKTFALNPEASVFFAPEKYASPKGTVSAYQLAQQLFCDPDFGETIPKRHLQMNLQPASLSVRFPAVNNSHKWLEFFFSDTQHMVYFRRIKK